MFDLTTILTLVAPAVIGPLACMICMRAIQRAEASRPTSHEVAPHRQIVPDSSSAAHPQIMLDASATQLAAEHVGTRNVA